MTVEELLKKLAVRETTASAVGRAGCWATFGRPMTGFALPCAARDSARRCQMEEHMNELIDELRRRVAACEHLADEHTEQNDEISRARCWGKAQAYWHAAELAERVLVQAVADRVERDR